MGSAPADPHEAAEDVPDQHETKSIDPRDLAGTSDYKDPVALNITRFLQSLDDDLDPENGIKIPEGVRNNSANVGNLDFSQSATAFESQAETVLDALYTGVTIQGTDASRDLVSVTAARDNFVRSLITRIIDEAIEQHDIPGVALAMELPEEEDYTYFARGVSDLENNIPMTPDVDFRVGSTTKTFTGITILKLAEEGRLSLDAPIKDLLPQEVVDLLEVNYDTSLITVRHLLNHFSGLPRFFPSTEIQNAWFLEPTTQFSKLELVQLMAGINWYEITDQTISDLVAAGVDRSILAQLVDYKGVKDTESNVLGLLADLPGVTDNDLDLILEYARVTTRPVSSPGVSWRYSNGNYLLLGMIIEEITGSTWESQVEKYCLEPLGMTNTHVPVTGESEIIGEQISHGYIDLYAETSNSIVGPHGTSGELVDRPDLSPTIAWGYGSIYSTVGDMARWIEALAEGDLLSDEYNAEQLDYEWVYGGGLGMGLGIMYLSEYDMLGHIGQVIGFDTAMQYQLANHTPIVAFANRTLLNGGKINDYVVKRVIHTLYGYGSENPTEAAH